jgi:hypothetical protein
MNVLLRAATVLAVAAIILGTAVPRAHARVFVHGFFPVPFAYAPYPYAYPVYAYPPYPYAYPYPVSPAIPPPGWEPGHWEWRTNRWGRRVEVWIPPHLR